MIRVQKGGLMVKKGEQKDLFGNVEETWQVESFTTPKKFYTVKRQGDKYTCSCPAYKKRKGDCKHILKIQGKNPYGYELKCKNGLPVDEVVSALQKMIRRGKEYEAVYFAYCLHVSGFGKYLWRRLSVISCEDCGTVNPLTPVVVNCLREMWENNVRSIKEPTLGDFLFPLQATLWMCRVDKSREGDSLANIVEEDFQKGAGPAIPEIALDPHTTRGKKKWGRWNTGTKAQNEKRIQMWFSEWALVLPKGKKDPWEEELKKRWLKK